ncbi:MAG: hypothetical protein ACT4P5_21955 [Armatimonadota bacterium]
MSVIATGEVEADHDVALALITDNPFTAFNDRSGALIGSGVQMNGLVHTTPPDANLGKEISRKLASR